MDNYNEHLSKALKFKTVSTHSENKSDYLEFDKFFEYLESAYPLLHSKLKKRVINEYSLLYEWAGKNENLKPIILMAHSDVVPVSEENESEWKYPAFSGTIADGYIWGRGAADCKGYLIGICEAVECLLRNDYQPERTIFLAFGHDEELGGKNGAAKIAQYLDSKGIKAEYILDEGGVIINRLLPGLDYSVALVGTSEKGYLSLEMTVSIAGGHSSMPQKETAIGILSSAVSKLEKHPFKASICGSTKEMLSTLAPKLKMPYRLIMSNLWLFGGLIKKKLGQSPDTNTLIRTTTAITIFKAGFKENVIPENAKAIVNYRILPGDTIDSIIQHVKRTINDPRVSVNKIDTHQVEASNISDTNTDGFKSLQKAINQVFPGVIVSPYLLLAGTDSKHYTAISKNLYRFGPLEICSQDMKMIHGINERVSIENFKKHVEFYVQLILNSDITC